MAGSAKWSNWTTVSLTVASVNDAPAGTDGTVTTLEDTPYVFASADFGFTDPLDNPANAFNRVVITSLPVAGTLTLDGTPVAAGQFVTVADIAAGKLSYSPAANANGSPYTSFTFQVEDDGGAANGGVNLDQSPNTLTIAVTPVNDAPAGTDGTVTTLEDTPYVFASADFGFTDPLDNPANAFNRVVITSLPVAGTLTLDGTPVAAGQFVTVADIAAGKLSYSPAANANGRPYTQLHVPGGRQRAARPMAASRYIACFVLFI